MNYRYITLKEQFLIDAIKHKMRMERYLLLGMYQHAMGSYRKYNRWMKRHNDLIVPPHIIDIQNKLAKMFIDNILYDQMLV